MLAETKADDWLQNPRVLLVDDDDSIRLALQRGLQKLGCEILHASDGETGLRMLKETSVQVVFLDLRMPGIDGHTFLRRLGTYASATRVVVVSGQGNMDDVVDVLRGGAVDYLRKPWSQPELAAAYTRALDAFALLAKNHKVARDTFAAPTTATPVMHSAAVHAPPLSPDYLDPSVIYQPPVATNHPTTVSGEPGAKLDAFQLVLERLKTGDVPLPAAPVVMSKMREMIRSNTVDAAQMATLVAQDQRLAAEVLRLANTAHYARAGRTSDLQTAVTRVGFRQIHHIVETVLLRSAFEGTDPWVRSCLRDIWRRGVATALAARSLVELVPNAQKIDASLAYLSGLFMDVGASFLLWVVDETGTKSGQPIDKASATASVATHHRSLGRRIIESWHIDPVVQLVAALHHADPGPCAGVGMYKALVAVGAMVAEQLKLPPDITQVGPVLDTLVQMKLLSTMGLNSGDLFRVASVIQPEFDAITSGG
jgi:CheY-like chemotaxis protein/HD-like signal output (HDOD) protein